MTDPLDRALTGLASEVEFPATPPLRAGVGARLREPARRGWTLPLPRALVLATVGLLVLATAVGALVGILPGLRIQPVSSLPPAASPDALGTRFALGTPVPVESVASLRPGVLGRPAEAYSLDGGDVVTLLYSPSAELPELGDTGIGLLVQVIQGEMDPERVEKLVPEVGAQITAVTVGGAPGYWISGPPHVLRYTGPDGEERTEATRIVGDVLVWSADGTLYRMESGLGLGATLELAESVGR